MGHGAIQAEKFAELLQGAGVELLVDVRRFPGSRRHPHFSRDAMATWLPENGITYRWEEDLGGRRRLPAGEEPADPWWTVEQFRAYAAYTRTAGFGRALDRVLADADRQGTAVMCSESVWWRCHRRLIADVTLLARHRPVLHLMHTGRLVPHPIAAGARLDDDGLVYWDRTSTA